jgi:hypothetical protein
MRKGLPVAVGSRADDTLLVHNKEIDSNTKRPDGSLQHAMESLYVRTRMLIPLEDQILFEINVCI